MRRFTTILFVFCALWCMVGRACWQEEDPKTYCGECGAEMANGHCPNENNTCPVCGESTHNPYNNCTWETAICQDCFIYGRGEVSIHNPGHVCPNENAYICGICGTNYHDYLYPPGSTLGNVDHCPHLYDTCSFCGASTHNAMLRCPNENGTTCATCGATIPHGGTCPNANGTTCATCGATIPHGETCANVNGTTCATCGATIPHGGTCPNVNGTTCATCGEFVEHGGVCPNGNGENCPVCGEWLEHGATCPNINGTECAVCGAHIEHGGVCPNGMGTTCTTCFATISHGGTCPNANKSCPVCGASIHNGTLTCANANDTCNVCGASTHNATHTCPNVGMTCGWCGASTHNATLTCPNGPHGGGGLDVAITCEVCGTTYEGLDECPYAHDTCAVCGGSMHNETHLCPNRNGTTCVVCGAAIAHGGICPNVNGMVCGVCGAAVAHGGVCPNVNGTVCATCGAAVAHGGTCPNGPHEPSCIVGTTHRVFVSGQVNMVDCPFNLYIKVKGNETTLYLHCIEASGLTGGSLAFLPARRKAEGLHRANREAMVFGRRLWPNLLQELNGISWTGNEECLLILSGQADAADAWAEMMGCCNGQGCPRHVRAKFTRVVRP